MVYTVQYTVQFTRQVLPAFKGAARAEAIPRVVVRKHGTCTRVVHAILDNRYLSMVKEWMDIDTHWAWCLRGMNATW